jgi:hypothetical protein
MRQDSANPIPHPAARAGWALVPLLALAAPAAALTLDQAVDEALSGNLDLQEQRRGLAVSQRDL